MNTRAWARALTPPIVVSLMQRWTGRTLRFAGHPRDWSDASRMSSGYAADNILDRVTRATRAVVSGEARYERDSVLFDEPEHPFAVTTALWRAAAISTDPGRLDVVDFGGSLGSSYRQCRPLLEGVQHLRWRVVEQPSFVAAGRREFSTDELSFFETLDQLPPPEGARLVLASGVLQYLEKPYDVLDAFSRTGARHLVIDRTPMSERSDDHLCIQHVPRHIYAASYPCRVLSRPKLLDSLQADWHVRCDFVCPEGARLTDEGMAFEFRGLILERRA